MSNRPSTFWERNKHIVFCLIIGALIVARLVLVDLWLSKKSLVYVSKEQLKTMMAAVERELERARNSKSEVAAQIAEQGHNPNNKAMEAQTIYLGLINGPHLRLESLDFMDVQAAVNLRSFLKNSCITIEKNPEGCTHPIFTSAEVFRALRSCPDQTQHRPEFQNLEFASWTSDERLICSPVEDCKHMTPDLKLSLDKPRGNDQTMIAKIVDVIWSDDSCRSPQKNVSTLKFSDVFLISEPHRTP